MTAYTGAGQNSYDPAGKYRVREIELVYRPDAEQEWLVRLHQPEGAGPFPALLSIHGGAWTSEARPGPEADRAIGLVKAFIVRQLSRSTAPSIR